jgi:hypothetical protein
MGGFDMNNKDSNMKFITMISFLVLFVLMILVNTLSLNGMKTWEIVASYPNLITPARYTGFIMGFIYLLLTAFTFYQLDFVPAHLTKLKNEVFGQIRILFIITSVINITWIFAWHYDFHALSLLLVIIILICLLYINRQLSLEELSKWDKIFIRLPFSVYYGWTFLAMVINTTILFVSIGWKGLGLPETFWAILILLGVLIIATVRMLRNRDLVYGLTILWGYGGILVKHISTSYLGGQYPEIIATTLVCIILLIIGEGYVYISKNKRG